jgi:hypothetical protein
VLDHWLDGTFPEANWSPFVKQETRKPGRRSGTGSEDWLPERRIIPIVIFIVVIGNVESW